ncbi:nuclear transport factor 2 family protein [Chelatococcus sp. GCM10030263]|uniref:nuclear transport factor 2 family protein n=1 Tax=Chelatococcus sp. GCM10030263 TaxID=3273387 RepID=UPI0036236512
MTQSPDMAATAAVWERRLYDAMVALDYDRLDALLADDVVYIHSTGVAESKAEYFAGLRQGLYDYETVETRSARTYADGRYVVRNGIVEMAVGERGKARNRLALLHTFVWRVEGANWRLVIRQATRIPG